MKTIALPYSTDSGTYGNTLQKTYTWYVQWYQNPTIVDTIKSNNAYVTINSFNKIGETVSTNFTIYSQNTITRKGTAGYTCSAFTFKSQPTIKINNITLGESIILYNSTLSKSVADNGNGTNVSSSITHSTNVTIDIPRHWFLTKYNKWTITISDALDIVDSGASLINTKTLAEFYVDPLFMIVVKKDGELFDVQDVIIKKNDVLYSVEQLFMRVGDKIAQG